jgi:endonuclease/exonuclease/phosphatase family metal-dependent hydrolase
MIGHSTLSYMSLMGLGLRSTGPTPHMIVLLLSLAGISCGGIQPPTAPAPPALLAVITWNMNAGRGDLTRLVSDLESGRLAGAPPAGYVLLLQEATEEGDHRVETFAAARTLSAFFVPIWNDGTRTRGNAIVSTAPLSDARAIALPRERQPRMAVAASITVAGERLFVVSVHLENRVSWLRGGLMSDTARGRQAEALLRALPVNEPGILGGDMNTWLGVNEPAWRTFRPRFPDTPADTPVPVPTFRDRLVLDHLFFDLPARWYATRRVVADRYGSDHHPVLGLLYR